MENTDLHNRLVALADKLDLITSELDDIIVAQKAIAEDDETDEANQEIYRYLVDIYEALDNASSDLHVVD